MVGMISEDYTFKQNKQNISRYFTNCDIQLFRNSHDKKISFNIYCNPDTLSGTSTMFYSTGDDGAFYSV